MIKAIVNGRILLPESEVKGKALLYNERIIGITDEANAREMADEIIDAQGLYVSPGLVDTHIHGYQDADATDGDIDGIRHMAKGLLENGVTAFLPTTLTEKWSLLETVLGFVGVGAGFLFVMNLPQAVLQVIMLAMMVYTGITMLRKN